MPTTTQNIIEQFLTRAREEPVQTTVGMIPPYSREFEQAENGEQAKPIIDDGSLRPRDFIGAQANDLHGKGPVSPEARKSSVKVANVLTISNVTNAGTTLPTLGSLFSPLGPLFGTTAAIALIISLLGITNITGERAAARNPKNKGASRVYLGLYTALSFTLTGISGIGTLLMLEQSKLENELSQTVVQEQIEAPLQEELTRRQQDPLLLEKTEECNNGRQRASQLEEGSRERQDIWLQVHGPYGVSPDYFKSIPFEQLPICQQVAFLQGEIRQQQEALTELNEMVAEQGAKSTLQQRNPQLFEQYFTEDGQIKSGSDAIRTALDFTWRKLTEPDLMALGSSLVTLLISFLLTVGTIGLIIKHAENKDVQASQDLTVKRVRDQFFNELIIAIQNLPDA